MSVEKIFSIVVIFNPDFNNVRKLVDELIAEGITPIVVDNSDEQNDCILENCTNVVRLGENLGIAAAQNIGIKKALAMGADKIIFFDQDSQLTQGFIKNLLSTFDDERVRIAAPVFYDIEKGFGYKLVDINKWGLRKKIEPESLVDQIDITVVISSGTVVDSKIFNEVGLMDESLFIDYVDTEWCLRCFYHGYKVRVNPKAVMYHSIGDNSIGVLGFNVPVHSPIRRYYRIRNSISLIKYRHVPKILMMREMLFSLVHQFLIVFTQRQKSKYIKYAFKAISDGFFHKMGKIDET